jgi:photosystem II protein
MHPPRRREIFVGRVAMTGFLSAVIGELLTGKGALGQLGLETRLPQPVVNWLVIAIVGFNVVTALNPFGSTFSEENQKDVRKRPTGAVQNPKKNLLNDPKARLPARP